MEWSQAKPYTTIPCGFWMWLGVFPVGMDLSWSWRLWQVFRSFEAPSVELYLLASVPTGTLGFNPSGPLDGDARVCSTCHLHQGICGFAAACGLCKRLQMSIPKRRTGPVGFPIGFRALGLLSYFFGEVPFSNLFNQQLKRLFIESQSKEVPDLSQQTLELFFVVFV